MMCFICQLILDLLFIVKGSSLIEVLFFSWAGFWVIVFLFSYFYILIKFFKSNWEVEVAVPVFLIIFIVIRIFSLAVSKFITVPTFFVKFVTKNNNLFYVPKYNKLGMEYITDKGFRVLGDYYSYRDAILTGASPINQYTDDSVNFDPIVSQSSDWFYVSYHHDVLFMPKVLLEQTFELFPTIIISMILIVFFWWYIHLKSPESMNSFLNYDISTDSKFIRSELLHDVLRERIDRSEAIKQEILIRKKFTFWGSLFLLFLLLYNFYYISIVGL